MKEFPFFVAAALCFLLFFFYLRRKFRPDDGRRACKVYRLYRELSGSASPEPDLWEKTARLYFEQAGLPPAETDKAALTLRVSCEDFMDRQDVLKTTRQKAVELARRILMLEHSLGGRQGRVQDTERLHTAVEAASARFFSK